MTRGDLRTRILELLNESASDPVFFSASEINDVIDEAMEVICEEAEAVKRTVFVPLLPGTAYYSLRGLGPDLMAPWRIWLQSQERRLTTATMNELDEQHPTWPTVTGDPWHWFPVSWDLFGIWPKPTSGGGVLRVDALAWPRALLHDGDQPELLDGDHEALAVYGLYDGSAKRWDFEMMLQAWSLFVGKAGIARGRHGKAMQARAFQVQADGGVLGADG